MSHGSPVLFVRIDACPRCSLSRYKLTTGGSQGAFGSLFHTGKCSIKQGRRAKELQGIKPLKPDLKQCEAEKSNGRGPFSMCGTHKMIRCTAKPTVIAKEVNPGADGKRGSMSLCSECKVQFIKQLGESFAAFKAIK